MGVPVPEMTPESIDEASAETLLSSLRTIAAAERRKHASVYNYWLSIRGNREFPPIHDLDPLEISDAGAFSILLEMIGGGEDAEIRHLGRAISGGLKVDNVSDAPNPSLLSCIATRLPVVAACRDAFAFEDEFETKEGKTRCWVSLLPFSATGTWIDFVYGFVSLDPGSILGQSVEAEAPAIEGAQEPQETFEVPVAEEVATTADEITQPLTTEQPFEDEVTSGMETVRLEDMVEPIPLEDIVEPIPFEEIAGLGVREEPLAWIDEPVDTLAPGPIEETAGSGTHEEVGSVDEHVETPTHEPVEETAGPLVTGEPADEVGETAETLGPDPVEEFTEAGSSESLPGPGLVDEPEPAPVSTPKPGFSKKFLETLASVKGFYGNPVEIELDPETVAFECGEAAEITPSDVSSPKLEGTLQIKLTDVRAKADEARQAKLRANTALYEGLGAAYDFALDAEDSPEEYLRLVQAEGLKIQLRSPMKPVAKLAFDGMCDDVMIRQLEAVLAWAFEEELPRGTLAERIEAEGGIAPILNRESKAA
ncbi:MAG TPA: hypothetical protein VGQ34_06690 [Sphingomicrobium sp.]|jgi:hypothetical protein|nr:hypothetical protein [Sphingomicrobium sp.]